MIAEWMLYCVAVGVLLAAGAAALERGLRALRWPTRWPWAAAMALTLALPIAARVLATPAATGPLPRMKVATDAAPSTEPLNSRPRRALPVDLAAMETPLRAVWLGSTLATAAALAAMSLVLARRRRRWAHAVVDGVPVLLSADVGPAGVGWIRARIVLPRWAAEGDDEARRLVLAHEQEHVRAGDPRLLACALAAVALVPWNPAAWWQLRRLRLAMEVDCDARVLRGRADVRAYGAALLDAGRRASRSRLALAAVSDPASSLERRIRIMTEPRSRRPFLAAAACAAVAAALLAAACEAPQPTAPSPSAPRTLTFDKQAAPPADELTLVDARAAVQQYFPDVLRQGMGADDKLLFVLDASGRIVDHRLITAPGGRVAIPEEEITAALEPYGNRVSHVSAFKTKPGELGPTPAQVLLVQMLPAGDARAGLPRRQALPARDERARADEALQAALQRGIRAADAQRIVGHANLRITVDAAGRVTDVSANPEADPRLVQAIRGALANVTLAPQPAVKTVGVWSGEGPGTPPAAPPRR